MRKGRGPAAAAGAAGGAAKPELWFVVNPAGANGRAERQWDRAAPQLRHGLRGRYRVKELLTLRRGHAEELARAAAAAGAAAVVAVGGDGTVNEVVNGLMEDAAAGRPAGPALGILPFGSGNDFVRSLGGPAGLEALIADLLALNHTAVDVGCIADGRDPARRRYFLNEASVGVAGAITRHVPRFKFLGGKLGYLAATARGLATYRRRPAALRVDGRAEALADPTLITVANGQFFGGGMRIAPGADPRDGRLELVVIERQGMFGFIRHSGKIASGAHVGLDFVTSRPAAEVEIDAAPAGAEPADAHLIEVDGDLFGHLPCRIRAVPKALKLIA